MKSSPINGSLYKGIARTSQALAERLEKLPGIDLTHSDTAQVKAINTDAMTCDILNSNGYLMKNVPIAANCGLEDGEVWGEIEYPSIDQWVIIEFLGERESFPIIRGTIYPYSNSKYQGSQKPVNSSNKAFTKKLLEKISPKVYRRIFKSGTSVEVKEDGTLIVETPDGTYVQIDATNKSFHVEDKNGNKIVSSSSGMTLTDKNNNVIEMGSSSVKINNNFEVLR